jgi:hypothetical protein
MARISTNLSGVITNGMIGEDLIHSLDVLFWHIRDDFGGQNWGQTSAASASGKPEIFPSARYPDYPFSEAVSYNGVLYLSGDVGVSTDGKLLAGGIGPESRQPWRLVLALKWSVLLQSLWEKPERQKRITISPFPTPT